MSTTETVPTWRVIVSVLLLLFAGYGFGVAFVDWIGTDMVGYWMWSSLAWMAMFFSAKLTA